MKSLMLVILSVMSSSTTARPLETRDLGGVLICNGANSTGYCEHGVYELDVCHNLETPLFQNSSTFAPDGDGFYCYPYATKCDGICMSPTGCTLGAVSFSYKFKFNLAEIGWEKGISSFECHRDDTAATTSGSR